MQYSIWYNIFQILLRLVRYNKFVRLSQSVYILYMFHIINIEKTKVPKSIVDHKFQIKWVLSEIK